MQVALEIRSSWARGCGANVMFRFHEFRCTLFPSSSQPRYPLPGGRISNSQGRGTLAGTARNW